jgi:hypothetical protein
MGVVVWVVVVVCGGGELSDTPDLSSVPDDKLFMSWLFTALSNHPKEQKSAKVKYLEILRKELFRRGLIPGVEAVND